MGVARRNTVVIDFSILPKRPDPTSIKEFLDRTLQLEMSQVKCIQLHNLQNCVFVKMSSMEVAVRFVEANNCKHCLKPNHTARYRIPFYVADTAIDVHLLDLPPEMSDETITSYMQQYGSVMTIKFDRWKNHWPGWHNGVRVVKMKLEKPIPSYITIDGETTVVTYPNQVKTCRSCTRAVHPGVRCSEAAKNQAPQKQIPVPTATNTIAQRKHNATSTDFPALPSSQQQTQTFPPSPSSSSEFHGFPEASSNTSTKHNNSIEKQQQTGTDDDFSGEELERASAPKRQLSGDSFSDSSSTTTTQTLKRPCSEQGCQNEGGTTNSIHNGKIEKTSKNRKNKM